VNVVDIGILVVTFLSAIIGLIRGITREVLGLISWAASASATFLCMPFGLSFASKYINNPILAQIVSASVLFVIFLIMFSFVSQFFSGIVKESRLGGIDRSLGFGYGIVRGVVVICVIEIAMSMLVGRVSYPEKIKESRFHTTIINVSNSIYGVLPRSLQNWILEHTQKPSVNSASKEPVAGKNGGETLQDKALGIAADHLVKGYGASRGNYSQTEEERIRQNQELAKSLATLKPKAEVNQAASQKAQKQNQAKLDRLLLGEEASEESTAQTPQESNPQDRNAQVQNSQAQNIQGQGASSQDANQ